MISDNTHHNYDDNEYDDDINDNKYYDDSEYDDDDKCQ